MVTRRRPYPRHSPALLMLALAAMAGCSSGTPRVTAPASTPPTTTIATTTTEPAPTTTIAPTPTTGAPTTAPTTVATPLHPRDVAAASSAGCATATPTPGTSIVPFQADGLVGSYIIDVPPAAVAGTPIPLVLDLHGYAERANVEVLESGLPAFGEKAGFVTVTPEITRPVPLWKIQLNSPDTPFIAALLDHLEATMCIDTNRVFAAGLSDGAFMTSILACDLSDRIAAAAPVAGILAPTGCAPKRAVPVVTFHGTADPFVSYDGGLGAGVETLPKPDGSGVIGSIPLSSVPIPNLVSVPTRAATWATRNGCTSETPGATTIAADVTLFSYDCPTGHEVQLYRIEGGGHSWPGSAFSKSIVAIVGPTTFSIDADTIIWQFFLDHPL